MNNGIVTIEHLLSMNSPLSIIDTPFEGIGKPEPLKHEWAGMRSRRINSEHRFIYEIKNKEIHIYSLKDHY